MAAMAPSYKPWHDKASGKTFLRPELGKCLHYYFYFIDQEFGLCYLRVGRQRLLARAAARARTD